MSHDLRLLTTLVLNVVLIHGDSETTVDKKKEIVQDFFTELGKEFFSIGV